MPFAATWMDPEIFILSEVRQRKRNIPYTQNLKINDTNEPIKQKETHKLREWTYGCQGKNAGEGEWESLDGHVHTAIFKMGNHQGPTVWQRELCSMLCDSLDGKGRMDTCVCMAESLRCVPETFTLLIGYTPILNKKFKKKRWWLGVKMYRHLWAFT